jgi:RNA polymerase sigma-70 factor, ECF subfamily
MIGGIEMDVTTYQDAPALRRDGMSSDSEGQRVRRPVQHGGENEVLMALVSAGDQQAFAELYDRLAGNVFGLVRRVLRDVAQSEEVTQEVFLEVWQNAKKYDETKGGVVSWILTMTHRRAIDRVRASQASHDRDLRIGVRDTVLFSDDVAESVEIKVEDEKVRRALARLTDLQRQAIELAYYGGLTHGQIADLLHVPSGTIKTRIRDGMIRLRDEMGVTA